MEEKAKFLHIDTASFLLYLLLVGLVTACARFALYGEYDYYLSEMVREALAAVAGLPPALRRKVERTPCVHDAWWERHLLAPKRNALAKGPGRWLVRWSLLARCHSAAARRCRRRHARSRVAL